MKKNKNKFGLNCIYIVYLLNNHNHTKKNYKMEKYNENTSRVMLQEVKDYLHDSFGYFVSNSMNSEEICQGIEAIWGFQIDENSRELIMNCLSSFAMEWENYPISDDGTTVFEEYELQCIEDNCIDNILYYVFGNIENLND